MFNSNLRKQDLDKYIETDLYLRVNSAKMKKNYFFASFDLLDFPFFFAFVCFFFGFTPPGKT